LTLGSQRKKGKDNKRQSFHRSSTWQTLEEIRSTKRICVFSWHILNHWRSTSKQSKLDRVLYCSLDVGLQNLGLSEKRNSSQRAECHRHQPTKGKKTATASAILKERESVVLGHNYSYRNPGGEVSNKHTNHHSIKKSKWVCVRPATLERREKMLSSTISTLLEAKVKAKENQGKSKGMKSQVKETVRHHDYHVINIDRQRNIEKEFKKEKPNSPGNEKIEKW